MPNIESCVFNFTCRMRVRQMMTLCMVAFYLNVALCHAPDAPDDDVFYAIDHAMRGNAGCGPEQIAEYNRCSQTARSTPGDDVCERVGKLSHCWPQCFCDHPRGYAVITGTLRSHCTEIPPCVAATQRRKLLRVSGGGFSGPSLSKSSPAPAESSSAPALRASASAVYIAAVVFIMRGINRDC